MKAKRFFNLFLIGLFLVFLSRWKLFLTEGIIGHNWDWNIPFLREQNRLAVFTFLFNWNESVFGGLSSPRIGNLLVFFIGAVSNGAIQSKFILFFVPFLSYVNSLILLSFLTRKFFNIDNSYGVFLGSIIYAFSPSVFNDFVGGQLIYLIGYSFIPLYVYFLFRFFEEKNYFMYIFPLSLMFFIFAGSHHWYFSAGLFLTIFISLLRIPRPSAGGDEAGKKEACPPEADLFLSEPEETPPFHGRGGFIFFFLKSSEKYETYKKFLILLFVLVSSTAFNLFFVLSFLGDIKETMPSLLKNEVLFFRILRSQTQTIDKVFVGSGYGDRNLFLKSLEGYRPIFFLFSYFILIFILANLFFKIKSIKNKKIVFWSSFIYLLGLFLVTAGRSPMGDFFIFLMKEIIVFRGFRTVFHFFVLPNLGYSILAMISLSAVDKNKRKIGILLVIFFFMANLPVFIKGDNGKESLQRQKRDSLDVYEVNSYYQQIIKQQYQDAEWYRVFIVPTTISPEYKETPYQKKGQGGDPEIIFSPKPILNDFTLTEKTKDFFNYIEENVVSDQPLNQKLLSFFSFKKIIYRKDISPSFSSLTKRYDHDLIDQKLRGLKPLLLSEYIDYYDLKNNSSFVPQFYIPDKFFYLYGETKDLIELVGSEKYGAGSAILLKDQTSFSGSFEKNLRNYIQEYLINAELEEKVGKEELEVFGEYPSTDLPYSPFKPGTFLYRLAQGRERFDFWRAKNSVGDRFGLHVFYANKRISELLSFSYFTSGERLKIVSDFRRNMDEAINIIENMDSIGYKDYWKIVADTRSLVGWQEGQLRKTTFGEETQKEIEEIFGMINRRLNKLKKEYDFSRQIYKFYVPKSGEYEIYSRETARDDWRLLEKKYLREGEGEYTLENNNFGENLVGDNLKINEYSSGSVFRVELDYRMPFGNSYFYINEGKEGEVMRFSLPSTGDNYEKFEFFFKSSEEARKAFVYFSLSDYENLKIEKIRQPEMLLKSVNEIEEINELTNYGETVPKITFMKINPTKYKIQVEGAEKPYNLVFSENFDSGWKVYIINNQLPITNHQYKEIVASYFDEKIKEEKHKNIFLHRSIFETWGKKPIPEEQHFLVNGYANSWYITPRDANGIKNYELVVEFEPQRLYYLGLFISFIMVGGSCIIMIVGKIREKYQKHLVSNAIN